MKTLRDVVFEAAEYEIHDREALHDIELALDERLENDTADFGLPDLPLEEPVRRLCEDLQLQPDWSRWAGDGWAPAGAFVRSEPSLFPSPSRKPSAAYAAAAARMQGRRRSLE